MRKRYCKDIDDARTTAEVHGEMFEDTLWFLSSDKRSIVGAQFGKLFVSIHQLADVRSGLIKMPREAKSMRFLFRAMLKPVHVQATNVKNYRG
jgi:hypothetical protein